MSKFKTIPITLVTGYLGSGKTTLLNHILTNTKGYKIAVIVNDIGEVNIDADLIEKGGIVNKKEESLVALQNGCICCTLRKDLIEQIHDIVKQQKFDHIIIEASGICEPIPIAQTINFLTESFKAKKMPIYCKLDAIVSVVDTLRMVQEFCCGDDLVKENIGEEDIENLVIQQIEFCDILILNKVSEVSSEELKRVRKIIKNLQPKAKIIEVDYSNVDINEILDTDLFDMENLLTSAGWFVELDKDIEDEDDDEVHHHHDHDDDDEDDDDGGSHLAQRGDDRAGDTAHGKAHIGGVGQRLNNGALNFDDVFFRQALPSSWLCGVLGVKRLHRRCELFVGCKAFAPQNGCGGGHMPYLFGLGPIQFAQTSVREKKHLALYADHRKGPVFVPAGF